MEGCTTTKFKMLNWELLPDLIQRVFYIFANHCNTYFDLNVTLFFAKDGITAFMAASHSGHAETVKMLLTHSDIDINTTCQVRTSDTMPFCRA